MDNSERPLLAKKGQDKEAKEPGAAWWQPAVFMFLRLSAWIAAPVLLAVFIGKWLDSELGTEPWLFLFLVGTVFVASMFVLARETVKEYDKIDKKTDKKTSDNEQN